MEIAFLTIRWQSLQTWFKTKKLTKQFPLAVGGLEDARLADAMLEAVIRRLSVIAERA